MPVSNTKHGLFSIISLTVLASPVCWADDFSLVQKTFLSEVKDSYVLNQEAYNYYQGVAKSLLSSRPGGSSSPQYFLAVDARKEKQIALLGFLDLQGEVRWAAAAPVSTGKPGQHDYFYTPVGVFENSLSNPNFRAEGTKNENGIRGYGVKGARVFDLGWQQAVKGWGQPEVREIRFQLHATDPDYLEKRLGTQASKGCVRLSHSLNRFLDKYAILDADYLASPKDPRAFVLKPDRTPVQYPGRLTLVLSSDFLIEQGRPVRNTDTSPAHLAVPSVQTTSRQ